VNIAYAKVSLSFLQALVRAIGCNWLVCLAVWMAFVALGFEHSVVNMYFIPAGIFLRLAGVPAPSAYSPEALSWLSFLWDNLVPVTLGNIIGGGVLVGMSYWSAYLRQARS
jgi:formate/nitrite transporter FocA (FNT family)